MPADPSRALESFAAEAEGWAAKAENAVLAEMSEDVAAALGLWQDVADGRLLPADAAEIIRRRTEAAAWRLHKDAEDKVLGVAVAAGEMILKLAVSVIAGA